MLSPVNVQNFQNFEFVLDLTQIMSANE